MCQFLTSPAVLLEFDTVASIAKFEKFCTGNPALLSEFSPKACIHLYTFTVILCFVLCNSQFNPIVKAHLHHVESENDTSLNSIVLAS